MSDNKLLKEFSEKDVNRLRNLISKNFGASTVTQVGFVKKEEERKEGDIWLEGGTKWTIKDGIKQTYTELDNIKKLFTMPLICPNCKNRMKDKLDKKMYPLFGKCFSCVQAYETKLKLEGKYEEYAREIMYNNARTFAEEAKGYIQEIENSEASGIFTDSGKKERWSGPAFNKSIVEKMKEELNELEEKIKQDTNEQPVQTSAQ